MRWTEKPFSEARRGVGPRTLRPGARKGPRPLPGTWGADLAISLCAESEKGSRRLQGTAYRPLKGGRGPCCHSSCPAGPGWGQLGCVSLCPEVILQKSFTPSSFSGVCWVLTGLGLGSQLQMQQRTDKFLPRGAGVLEEVDGRLVSRPSWGPRVVTRAGCRAGLWLVPTPEGPGALEIAGKGGPGRANGDCKGLRVLGVWLRVGAAWAWGRITAELRGGRPSVVSTHSLLVSSALGFLREKRRALIRGAARCIFALKERSAEGLVWGCGCRL